MKMTEVDSQREEGREGERAGGRESRRERKKEDTLFMGEMSGRFHHILVDSKEFKMEKEAFG